MKIQCPKCQSFQKVPSEYKNKSIHCIKCKEEFIAIPANPSRFWPICYLFCVIWIISLIADYYYSYKKGHTEGYCEGQNFIIKTLNDFSGEQTTYSNNYQPFVSYLDNEYINSSLPVGEIIFFDYKIINPSSTFWLISWLIEFKSNLTGSVDIQFRFHDKEGFLLETDYLYNQYVVEGEYHEFTSTILIENKICKEISYATCFIKQS